MRCLCLLLLLFSRPRVVEPVAAFGQKFLIALPKMFHTDGEDKSNIVLYMLTLAAENRVDISTPHFPGGGGLTKRIVLRSLVNTSHVLHSEYNSRLEMGKKWSIKLVGTETFTLTVAMRRNVNSSAALLAIPVDYWGFRYYAATLGGNPSIQIISSKDDNSIEVKLRIYPAQFTLQYEGIEYKNGSVLKFKLAEGQAFAISKCADDQFMGSDGNMTGTYMFGRYRIGVISGNCLTYGLAKFCHAFERIKGKWMDIAVEMMPPLKAYGYEFVVFCVRRLLQGFFIIIAPHKHTNVTIHGYTEETKLQATLISDIHHAIDERGVTVRANKPILVVFIMPSACIDSRTLMPTERFGNSGLCVLVPTWLYYWAYYISTSEGAWIVVTAVIRSADQRKLMVDGSVQYDAKWYSILGSETWTYGAIEPARTTYHVIKTAANVNFACYSYHSFVNTSFISPSGFVPCGNPSQVKPFPGDLIDNDCDGNIDEEPMDGVDNDNDTLVDEDIEEEKAQEQELLVTPLVGFENETDGVFDTPRVTVVEAQEVLPTPVTPVVETNTNEVTGEMNAATEDLSTKKTDHSTTEESVAEITTKCPPFHFGDDCTSCINCGIDCDRVTGHCEHCKPGFKNKNKGCDTKCEENEFGRDCHFSCFERCGKDCIDRVTGECPDEFYKLFYLLILLIPIGLSLWAIRRRAIYLSAEGEAPRRRLRTESGIQVSPTIQKSDTTL